jgi:hypothetical protein
VTSSYGGADLTIQGNGFRPSTTTTTNYAYLAVLASNGGATGCGNGGAITSIPVVDSHGSFSALISVCGLGLANEWFQIVGQDSTTNFYTNIILTISDGRTGPGPLPQISGPEAVTSSGGCANFEVQGSGFVPSTDPTNPNTAYVAVFASTDFQANGTIYATVDSSGSFSAILPICGLGLTHDLIEIGSEDTASFLYANMIYTSPDD